MNILNNKHTQVFYNEDYPHAYEEDSNHFNSRFVVVLELVKIIITNTPF